MEEPNKGKANAINKGIASSTKEIIVILDADTIVNSNSLTEIVQPFRDERVGAVAGNVNVLNQNKTLGKIQVLEYALSMNIVRGILSLFSMVTCISGSFGAYSRTALVDGGSAFSTDTITEDFDSTVTVLKRGYLIKYQENALAYTEVPESLNSYAKQRLRWYRGFFQGIRKHSDFFFKSNYGISRNLAFFFLVNGQMFVPLISLINLIAIIPFLIIFNWEIVFTIMSLHFITLSLLSIFSIRLSHTNSKYLIYVPLTFVYFKILDFVFLKGLVFEMIRKKSDWDHAERIEIQP